MPVSTDADCLGADAGPEGVLAVLVLLHELVLGEQLMQLERRQARLE